MPVNRREVRKLVRKLGVNARPNEQKAALGTITPLLKVQVQTSVTPSLLNSWGCWGLPTPPCLRLEQHQRYTSCSCLQRMMRARVSSLVLVPSLHWC
ncbi:hypothetical protein FOA52_013313 [Chlamydomonas sp. UWO 241]|nr:hypothetical protein FOA52_013313 [Chlamydomonas sp. UWO 241]